MFPAPCQPKAYPPGHRPAAVDWTDAVLAERRWRNELYLGPQTPLSHDARKAFHGLRWWEPDPRFRLAEVRLLRHGAPRPAALAATGDESVSMVEVGVFAFELAGAPCRLLAFEPSPGEVDETYLLVPFRDQTTGKETYGAGRYLDLEPHAHDVYELDFNRAYHPYCAYDDAWSCTMAPRENTLPVRVEAGERLS